MVNDGEIIPTVTTPVVDPPTATVPGTSTSDSETATPGYTVQDAVVGTPVYPHLKEYPTFDNAQDFQNWLNSLSPKEQMEYRMEMQGRGIFSMREGPLTEADLEHLVTVALDYETLFDIGFETEGEQLVKEIQCTIINATQYGTIIEFKLDNGVTIHQLCDIIADVTVGETIDVFVMFNRY
jgi:hypothetical protein